MKPGLKVKSEASTILPRSFPFITFPISAILPSTTITSSLTPTEPEPSITVAPRTVKVLSAIINLNLQPWDTSEQIRQAIRHQLQIQFLSSMVLDRMLDRELRL